MVDFSELPINIEGVGPVHMNRTRVLIEPRAGMRSPNGYDLFKKLPQLLDPDTASCHIEPGKRWNGESSMWFRGVARLRPFINLKTFTVVAGVGAIQGNIKIPIPESIRTLVIPPLHTDHVGIVFVGERSVTVQTLKRDASYVTADDGTIRQHIETVIIGGGALAKYISDVSGVKAAVDQLVDWALDINRRHFLAGRRSFLMAPARDFGWEGDNWVFETAALERYSHSLYEAVTDYAMGGAPAVVPKLWKQMCTKTAHAFGTLRGGPEHTSAQQSNFEAASADALWSDIGPRHSKLFPG